MTELSKFLVQFWWARGAVAALAFLSFSEPLLNLQKTDLLRIVHAMLFGWDKILAGLVDLIAEVIPIHIYPTSITLVIIAITTVFPTIILSINRMLSINFRMSPKAFSLCLLGSLVGMLALTATLFFSWVLNTTDSEGVNSERVRHVLTEIREYPSLLVLADEYEMCIKREHFGRKACNEILDDEKLELLPKDLQEEIVELNLLLVQLAQETREFAREIYFVVFVLVIMCIAQNCYFSKSYARGVLHFSLFVLTLEVLYLLPIVGAGLDRLADSVLEANT